MDILQEMIRQNPWWRDASSINNDQKIVEWRRSLRYEPQLMHDIEYSFGDGRAVVYTIRGPRQVGKTTLMKLQIKRLLDGNVRPLHVLYYTLDLARQPEDVVDLVAAYMTYTKRRRGEGRCYLFLDEITSIRDWQKGIKFLVDTNRVDNCTILVTGSHTMDLKNATERLPGRKGGVRGGHDHTLLPMKFSEYASVLSPEVRSYVGRQSLSSEDRMDALRGLANGVVDERVDRLTMCLEDLNSLLHEYMITGGLPPVVARHEREQILGDPEYETYTDALLGEWHRLGKNASMLVGFGRRLVETTGSPVSWEGISNKSSLGSPNTARDYADALERLFVVSVTYRYDMAAGAPMFGKNKKIYFTDPFLLHMFRTWSGPHHISRSSIQYVLSDAGRGSMLETVTASHLVRLASLLLGKRSTFDPHNHVFYWRDSKSREVDFVLYDGDQIRLPIEVKSGSRVDARDLGGLTRFVSGAGTVGLVLSRDTIDERSSYLVVPASVFLALI